VVDAQQATENEKHIRLHSEFLLQQATHKLSTSQVFDDGPLQEMSREIKNLRDEFQEDQDVTPLQSLLCRVEALEKMIGAKEATEQQQTIHQLTLEIENGQREMENMRNRRFDKLNPTEVTALLRSAVKNNSSRTQEFLQNNLESQQAFDVLKLKNEQLQEEISRFRVALDLCEKEKRLAESKVQFLQSEFTDLFFELFEKEKKKKLASRRVKKVVERSNSMAIPTWK